MRNSFIRVLINLIETLNEKVKIYNLYGMIKIWIKVKNWLKNQKINYVFLSLKKLIKKSKLKFQNQNLFLHFKFNLIKRILCKLKIETFIFKKILKLHNKENILIF